MGGHHSGGKPHHLSIFYRLRYLLLALTSLLVCSSIALLTCSSGAQGRRSGALSERCSKESLEMAALGSEKTSHQDSFKPCQASTREVLIDIESMRFGRFLGKGSFGEVYCATWQGAEVAVKQV